MSLFFCILRNYLQNRSPCKTSEELSGDPSPPYPLSTVYTAWRWSTLRRDAPFFHVRILLPGTLTLGCPLVSSCSPSRARQKPHLHHREQPSALGARCPVSPPSSPLILSFPLLSSRLPSLPPLCCALFCNIENCSTRHLRRGTPHTEAPRMRESCLISPTYSHHCVLKWTTALEELASIRGGLRSRGFVNAILLLSDVSWPANLFYRALPLKKCSS